MAKSLAAPESQGPDKDEAQMEMLWKPELKHLEMKLCKYNSGNPEKMLEVVRHIMEEADYDALMDAMGDAGKSLKEQLEDGLWADAVAKGKINLA
jgi:hypothetical protein